MPIPNADSIRSGYDTADWVWFQDATTTVLTASANDLRGGKVVTIFYSQNGEHDAIFDRFARHLGSELNAQGYAVTPLWDERQFKIALPEFAEVGMLMPEGWARR